MTDERPDDPVQEKQIHDETEAIVAPFAGVYPPPMLDELRRLVRLSLRADPYAQKLLKAVRPRGVPTESGKEDLRAFADPEPARKASGGGA
jgi:hypothetical protein